MLELEPAGAVDVTPPTMDISQVSDFITRVGFPTAVTAFLLWERYRIIGRLVDVLNKLVEVEEQERQLLERLER